MTLTDNQIAARLSIVREELADMVRELDQLIKVLNDRYPSPTIKPVGAIGNDIEIPRGFT